MRLRIHRGTKQIGGNCIELECSGKSILLDLGLPLNVDGPSLSQLPTIAGLIDGTNTNLLGIVISHPHVDHYGLLSCVSPTIPVFIGASAKTLLEAAAPFTGATNLPQVVSTYKNRKKFRIGPFSVFPFLMDHSAFDAYALLVEADGKRIFYSGDFRAHGRKAHAFEAFVRKPPVKVDLMLMEGTTLGREDKELPLKESELEIQASETMKSTDGIALAYFSAQNIDRLVTFFRAALRSGRKLIIDVYTAHILEKLAIRSLPSASSSDVRVYLPKNQKRQIMRTGRFDLVEPFKSRRIFASEIAAAPQKWVMMFRSSMADDLETIGNLHGSTLIYSMWPGYLERDRNDIRKWCSNLGVKFVIQHTSGHAHATDLRRFVEAVGPGVLVPIHTVRPTAFNKLYVNVRHADDREWLNVAD